MSDNNQLYGKYYVGKIYVECNITVTLITTCFRTYVKLSCTFEVKNSFLKLVHAF